MKNLCVDEKDEARVQIFIEDVPDDSIEQSSKDNFIYKEENTTKIGVVERDDINIEKPIVIIKLELKASKVADERVVVFEVELTRNITTLSSIFLIVVLSGGGKTGL